jgi:hypothetical protein
VYQGNDMRLFNPIAPAALLVPTLVDGQAPSPIANPGRSKSVLFHHPKTILEDHPPKTQQNTMSSPKTTKNLSNPNKPNNISAKNSWPFSYAQTSTIKLVSK